MRMGFAKIIGYLFFGQLILQVVRFYEGLFWIWRLVDYLCMVAFFPAESMFGGNFMYSSARNFGISLLIDTVVWVLLIFAAMKYKAPLVEKFMQKL